MDLATIIWHVSIPTPSCLDDAPEKQIAAQFATSTSWTIDGSLPDPVHEPTRAIPSMHPGSLFGPFKFQKYAKDSEFIVNKCMLPEILAILSGEPR